MGDCGQSTHSVQQEGKFSYTEGYQEGKCHCIEVSYGWTLKRYQRM